MSIINFIDLETTGFYYKKVDRIVEFAILKYEPFENKFLDSKVELINPDIFISKEVSKIHGITNEHVKNKPFFQEKAHIFLDIMKDKQYIAGHNIDRFDIPFLLQEMIRAGIEVPNDFYIIDTLKLSKKLIPGLKSYSLDALCDYFEIDKSKRTVHGALIDCELTKEVFNKLRDKFNLIDHLIYVDDDYIKGKNLNYDICKKETTAPKYLNISEEVEQKVLSVLKKEKACIPWINFKTPKIIQFSSDINDKDFLPLITITNRYKFISQKIFSKFLQENGILDENLYPTEIALKNNIVKYKIKTSNNREIIYLSFNDAYIKYLFKEDKDIIKLLKQKTVLDLQENKLI